MDSFRISSIKRDVFQHEAVDTVACAVSQNMLSSEDWQKNNNGLLGLTFV
jgi:hypothetical protein